MKEHRIMVDPLKFAVSLPTGLVLLYLAWSAIRLSAYLIAAVFILIAAVFFCVMFLYGSVLILSEEGIRSVFLFVTVRSYSWNQIRETGVVGTKIFNGTSKKKKAGRRYIYFSPEALNEDQRFRLALEWPPRKEMLYCIYNRQNADVIQFFWRKPVASYNAGDIFTAEFPSEE